MRKLSEFSVNYPISVLMLVLAVLLLGYISFDKLGMDLFPDLNNPRIFVEIRAGERPPEEMEKQFVKTIESLAIRQKQVIQVSSVTRAGSAQITVEYSWDADMDEAFLDLQKSLSSYSQNSDLEELNLSQHDPNSAPVLLIGFSHPQITDMDALRQVAANYVRNELIRQEGIAAVEIIGAEEKIVVVETDRYQLEAQGLTLATVAAQIQASNINASGGSIVEKGKRYLIKSVGEFQTLEEIGNVIVTRRAAQTAGANAQNPETTPVYLRDIAEISFRNERPDNIVRINGERCLALAIYKETKYNTVKAVERLDETLAELGKALPGYRFRVIQNQASFIRSAVNEVEETALIGIILAVMVLYLFLRRFGATLVMSIAIPISIVATFNLMYFNGLTLNIMTLGGLALGAGMLVDNAIVVMENIFRHLENGMPLREAAIEGASQVGGAITASTLTTIIVFLPIVYLHGAAGELFKEQAWTVAFSLLSSLVVAILVIPMLSHRFLPSKTEAAAHYAGYFVRYRRFLGTLLERRWLVLAGGLLLVLIGFALLPLVGSEFIPRAETGAFRIDVRLEEGASLAHTDRAVAGLERIIREVGGEALEDVYTQIGPAEGLSSDESIFFEGENTAVIHVFLQSAPEATDALIARLQTVLAAQTDMEIDFVKDESALQISLGTGEAPLVIEIAGDDLEQIRGLTEQAVAKLPEVGEVLSWETNFEAGRPEVNVVVDRIRAGIYEVQMQTVSEQLKDKLEGRDAGQFEHDGELREISIKLPPPDIRELGNLYIDNNQQKVRLDELSTLSASVSPREIYRRNQTRIGKISLQLKGNKPLDQVVSEVRAALAGIEFPPNYRYLITGEEQKRAESFASLKFALLLSIALIYMVLAAQFESLRHPFTILLTIPLAAVGAIVIFFVLGMPLNIMAYIGIIMLVGIAVNDSIILVDAINQLRRDGAALDEAILDAGQRRIRPIIMTSLTTILALLPLTFGYGDSASLRAPMALAVIGGLVTSTILTLVVIPCAYYVIDGLRLRRGEG